MIIVVKKGGGQTKISIIIKSPQFDKSNMNKRLPGIFGDWYYQTSKKRENEKRKIQVSV